VSVLNNNVMPSPVHSRTPSEVWSWSCC